MAILKIDINLNEFNDDEIIDEISNRINSKRSGGKFRKKLFDEIGENSTKSNYLLDQLKQEFIDLHFYEITLEQLESLICK